MTSGAATFTRGSRPGSRAAARDGTEIRGQLTPGFVSASAVIRLEGAGVPDPESLHRLALRRVTGDGVARDWREAQRLFGVAASAGHAGAGGALASLLALGGVTPPDWAGAVRVLESIVPNSVSAARALYLVGRMALSADGGPLKPPKMTRVAESPRLAIAERLFTPEECAHVRALALPNLRPSVVTDPGSGQLRPHPIRTSDGAVLGPIQQDLVLHALNRRIAAATGTLIEEGEPTTVLRYTPGQQYCLHHDCLPGEANQRVVTVIVYLNDDFEGGATVFEALGRAFRPAAGDALVFSNTGPDGRPDQRSRHAGLPVERGEKWIATRWIRRSRFDPWGLYK